jgi:hypothetical protein
MRDGIPADVVAEFRMPAARIVVRGHVKETWLIDVNESQSLLLPFPSTI